MFIHRRQRSHKQKRAAMVSLVVFILGIGILLGIQLMQLMDFKDRAIVTMQQGRDAYESRDWQGIAKAIDDADLIVAEAAVMHDKYFFLRHFAFVSDYYNEAGLLLDVAEDALATARIAVQGITPYVGSLGLTADSPEASVDERIESIVIVLPQLLPVIDHMEEPLVETTKGLLALNPEVYPENFQGKAVRSEIVALQETLPVALSLFEEIGPLMKHVPVALGEPSPTEYLILFMNDKERRPNMGFMTAFTYVTFDSGAFEIGETSDIYQISDEESFLPIPTPLVTYLKAGGFHLRDINFSPDLGSSMDNFFYYWDQLGYDPVDGVVAVDTEFLKLLLSVTGPIALDAYNVDYALYPGLPEACAVGGEEFTSENVVCRLELFSEKFIFSSDDRKAILGDLMKEIIDWVLHSPQESWGDLVTATVEGLGKKHMLVHFLDADLDELAGRHNISGTIARADEADFWLDVEGEYTSFSFTSGHDYLHINDANLAGLKSDMFITRAINHVVQKRADGRLVATVSITYHNTGENDGWLNAVGRNYTRVYVPLGSELDHWEGGDQLGGPIVMEDLGKTVFDNFVLVPPLEQKTLLFEYVLPEGIDVEGYTLLLQKQAGLDRADYTLTLPSGDVRSFVFDKDMVVGN